jgi:hypothetical protein
MSGLPQSRASIASALLTLTCVATAVAHAGTPNPTRYPLHLHILASDTTYRTPRMNPGIPASCDTVDGVLSSISIDSGGPISLNGFAGDPCAVGPDFMRGGMLDNHDYDPVFSGTGRADLVSPPSTTQGLSFRYDNCGRMRVPIGFTSLPARWKSFGRKLEVLIPSDRIPVKDRPVPPERCTLTVTLHDFVYLLLRNGSLVEISQEDYWTKPALRVFLSGRTPSIQPRLQQYTIPAHPNQ